MVDVKYRNDRIRDLEAENARLRAQVEALEYQDDRIRSILARSREAREENASLRTELAYWRSVAEDPGIYWGDDNPPYQLPD